MQFIDGRFIKAHQHSTGAASLDKQDKGYDSNHVRSLISESGAMSVFPEKLTQQ